MTNVRDTTAINDLIILGRACPEPLKDGRVTVCLGGYSHDLGFVRIYPTRSDMPWRRWDIVSVTVEKDPRDNRVESWKIAGSKSDWDNLGHKIKVIGKYPKKNWSHLVVNLADDCVMDINNAKRSLGIIRPDVLEKYFGDNPLYGELFQLALPGFIEDTAVKRDFPQEPRVRYLCENCKTKTFHDQQILEWGFYEWIRKNPDNIEQVWENAQFDSLNHEIYFFVGNQLKYRTSFLVISVLRVPKGEVQFPLSSLRKWTPT